MAAVSQWPAVKPAKSTGDWIASPVERSMRGWLPRFGVQLCKAALFSVFLAVSSGSVALAQNLGDDPALGEEIPDGDLRVSTPPLRDDPGLEDLTGQQIARNMVRVVFDIDPTRAAILAETGGDEALPVLAKWVDPIFYSVSGDGATRSEIVDTALLAAKVEKLAPIEIRPATGGQAANLNVLVLTELVRADLAAQMRDSLAKGDVDSIDPVVSAWLTDFSTPCAATFRADENRFGAIIEAMVLIRAELDPPSRTRCLRRGLLQAFGLRNLHQDVAPSLLNPLDVFFKPTDHDMALFRLLYDPRLTPGSTRDDVESVAQSVAIEIWGAEP